MPPPPGAAAAAVARDSRPAPAAGEPREKFIDKAWKLDSAWSLMGRVGTAVSGLFNQFHHSIRVVVQGGPDADIRRVWYLACAAAFGRYRNGVKDSLGETSLQGVWNVHSKSCAVEVFYRTNAVNQFFDRGKDPLKLRSPGTDVIVGGVRVNAPLDKFTDPTASSYAFIHRGPEQLTVGADWPTWLRQGDAGRVVRPKVTWVGAFCTARPLAEGVDANGQGTRHAVIGRTFGLPGVFREWPIVLDSGITQIATFVSYPARVTAAISPLGGAAFPNNLPVEETISRMVTLPDDGRVITTADKSDPRVQPPVPLTDGTGRYNGLVGLVAQALHCPCFLPTTPPCTTRPRANAPGVFVYAPGTPTAQSFEGLNNAITGPGGERPNNPAAGGGAVFGAGPAQIINLTETADLCDGRPAPRPGPAASGGVVPGFGE